MVNISIKRLGIVLLLIITIAGGTFLLGKKSANNSNYQVLDSITSIGQSQSPYEKCMYQCMEGKGENASYCKADLDDFIENYDKYYSPYGVSSAFTAKYADKSNPQSKDAAYKALCFRFVVGCRVSLCKDYLGK